MRRLTCLIVSALLLTGAQPIIAATTGSVAGQVTNAETREPLQGVNIAIKEAGLTTVTDASGYYRISNVPPGSYSISAELVGFAPALVTDVRIVMDLQSRVPISMQTQVTEEEEVIIIEDTLRTNPDSTQTLYIRTLEDQILTKTDPSTFYQVPGIVSTVPGVVQDSTGNLHIRGGRDTDIGWMIEGIPVITPIDSLFGTNLVTVGMSRMEVYTGGYQAEYGSAISGVLNEIKRRGSDVRGGWMEATLGANQHSGIYAEAGNVLDNGLDWYLGNYTWGTDFERWVASSADSSDSVLKAVYPASDRDRVTLLGAIGSAEYRLPEVTPGYVDSNRTNQQYGLIGLTWSHQVSSDSHWLIRPYYFLSDIAFRGLSTEIGEYTESRSLQRGLQGELHKSFGRTHQAQLGFWYIDGTNRFYRYIPDLAMRFYGDPEISEMLDPFEFTSNVRTQQIALYLQDKISLSDAWTLDAGVRYDRFKYDKTVNADDKDSQVSPRIGLAWAQDLRSVIRASFGRFIQFVPTSVLDRQFTNTMWEMLYTADADLAPERATSYEVSWERQFSDHGLFRVTPYYREYKNLLDRVPLDPNDPYSPLTFVNAARAKSQGMELYLDRQIGDTVHGWISYTLSRTRQMNTYTGLWEYASWDQRHTVDATVVKQMGLGEASVRMQYGSGLTWSSSEDEKQNDRRLPEAIVLSLGISRKLNEHPDAGTLTFNIYNVLNNYVVTSRGPDGEALTATQPRFIGVSFSKKI